MTRPLLVLCACAAAAAAQQDASVAPKDAAFVEITAPRATWFVHEAVPITLRVGIEPEFFRRNAIQPTRQPLDVPLRVEAAFLQELPGMEPVGGDLDVSPAPGRLGFALNDAPVFGRKVEDRMVGGRRYAVLEVTRHLSASRPGLVVVPAPAVRFVHASRFEEDLVSGRVPLDRHEAVVRGAELELLIEPLPEEGKPPGFTGAVGHISVRASASPLEIEAGSSVKLELEISGEGSLAAFQAPRLESLPGWRSLGVIERDAPRGRKLVYDLVPSGPQVKEIPAIAFTFFEPEPKPRYRTIRTEPIAVRVREPAAAPTPPPAGGTPAAPEAAAGLAGLKPAGAEGAERAFAAGRVAEARTLFLAALARNEAPDGALLYDLGNCAFRLGDPAGALLWWRRAALRLPRDADVRHNLGLAARELGVEPPARSVLDAFTPVEVRIAGLVLCALGIAAAFGLRHRPLRLLAAVAAVLGLALVAWAWLPSRASDAVVVAREIVVRADPHSEAPVTLRLRAGESVGIAEGSDRWVRVEHARGRGWVERSAVGVVD